MPGKIKRLSDPALHGNHRACQPCGGSGRSYVEPGQDCAWCNGRGWEPRTDAEIVAIMVREARRWYWPAKERQNA